MTEQLWDKIARAAYENRVSLIECGTERQNWPAWDEHEKADADEWRDMADAVLAVLDDVRAEAWDEGMEAGQKAVILKAFTPNNPYREADQ